MTRIGSRIGIDANLPLILDGERRGDPAPQVARPEVIADTGAGWVRLNFVLGPWDRPSDKRRFRSRTWEEAYGEIIGGLRAKGLSLYGLISNEAVGSGLDDRFRSAPGNQTADPWLEEYVHNFVAIVRMFRRDVQVYESFNEPDDWHAADRNWVHPGWFAILLQRLHDAVRGDADIRHVKLVSGPLQGLEINGNAAAAYLRQTYAWGKAHLGWDRPDGAFPFDGVGYHLYFREGFHANWPEQERNVRAMYRDFTRGMMQVIQQEERRPKPLYISEIGWHSHEDPSFQARNLSLGLNLVAEDPNVGLAFWFCTQDFGSNGGRKWYGLYRPGELTPANRKPAFDAFRATCNTDPEPQVTILYTNQQMINAFHGAGVAMGLGNPWELLERAGLDLGQMAQDRPGRYAGPPIEQLPHLSDQERALVRSQLPAPRRLGRAAAVSFAAEGAAGYLRHRGELFDMPLAPPAGQLLDPGAAATWTQRVMIDTWNRYGGLLGGLSEQLAIDPAVAVAVMAIEAGGRGFSADGRMVIRFENHIFFDRWGRHQATLFDRHFRLDPDRAWQKHAWRPAEDAPWQEFHGSQRAEWEVFDFAARLNPRAARLSISMGAAQIMGFNHAVIGYGTVEEMFDAFAASSHSQLLGFFDFVCGPGGSSRRLDALQQCDFAAFAALYNGPGQAARYAGLLNEGVDAFQRMIGQ
jgi:hypothetical protein